MYNNSQKRIYLENSIYFVTTKTKINYPYFRDPVLAELFIQELGITQRMKECSIFGYVIMPDHVHMLIYPCGQSNISQIMFTIKKQYSHEANRILGYNETMLAPHSVGGQTFARLRKYVHTHRIINDIRQRKFAWQSSFHDHIVRDEEDLYVHVEYIKRNPVNAG